MTDHHTTEPKAHADGVGASAAHPQKASHSKTYARLLVMALLSFGAMYLLMYAMVDRLANIHHNFNQAYMAALMAAPMVMLELALMAGMYPSKKINAAVIALSAIVFVGAFFGIREQVAISDRQFLQSMIPHHAAAILMCEQAQTTDPEIDRLCQAIVSSQQTEIEQMNALLARS